MWRGIVLKSRGENNVNISYKSEFLNYRNLAIRRFLLYTALRDGEWCRRGVEPRFARSIAKSNAHRRKPSALEHVAQRASRKNKTEPGRLGFIFGGDEGARTHDLTDVNRAL